MGLKLQSSSGGSIEINAPVTATVFTQTVPAANGTLMVADSYGNPTISGGMIHWSQNINSTIVTATNTNTLSCGPITIATGVTVTIGNGSYWTII